RPPSRLADTEYPQDSAAIEHRVERPPRGAWELLRRYGHDGRPALSHNGTCEFIPAHRWCPAEMVSAPSRKARLLARLRNIQDRFGNIVRRGGTADLIGDHAKL